MWGNKPFPEFGEYFLKYNEASEEIGHLQKPRMLGCVAVERCMVACDAAG
jgi:hypothetical protein